MKKTTLLFVAFIIIALFGSPTASAQLPIKLPKISKPKPKPTATETTQPSPVSETQPAQPQPEAPDTTKPTESARNSAAGDDQPTIAKDSVQVTAFTLNVFQKNYDIWSWVPRITYRVNGPIASGSQLYVDFTLPGKGPWVKFDCRTEETQKDRWWKTECGADAIPEEKGSTYTGPVNFAIKMRNELAGTDTTLFTGRMKVGKAHSNESGPKVVNHFVYYVDHDWNLPIAYVFLSPADVHGWKLPEFRVAFWVRGEATNFQPHLFYQGKEVGKIRYGTDEVGKPNCEAEVENETTHYVDDSLPQKAKWARVECRFFNVAGWDKREDNPGRLPDQVGSIHLLSSNPGEYEFKVLWKNHLARAIKFTVGPDGKFENGIAIANKLGSHRVIVPVQIIGDLDGPWDRAAWKSDAFYGNPLTGFSPSP